MDILFKIEIDYFHKYHFELEVRITSNRCFKHLTI